MRRELREQRENVLLSVEGQERQVQDDSEPVAVNDEEECKESVNGSLGDNVGVKTVAKVDRVDVVTAGKGEARISQAQKNSNRSVGYTSSCIKINSPLKITVHDREEDLEEQVDGVDQHRQQVEPRFARHCGQKVEEEEEQLEAMARERLLEKVSTDAAKEVLDANVEELLNRSGVQSRNWR